MDELFGRGFISVWWRINNRDNRSWARGVTRAHRNSNGGGAPVTPLPMEGGSLGLAAFDPEPCRTVAELQQEQAKVDQRLIAVAGDLDEANVHRVVAVYRGERIQRERIDRLLLHLFQHQIHHRGQAHAMLSGTSVPPPQLDRFFSVGDADLCKDEFAMLGWTENTVWNA